MRGHIETSCQGPWLGLTTNYKDEGYRWMDGSRMEDPPFLNIKKNTNSPITSTYDCCIEMEDPVYGDTSDAHPQGRLPAKNQAPQQVSLRLCIL